MKAMNVPEIEAVAEEINQLRGFEVTKILYDEKAFQLSLSKDKDYRWLTLSLRPGVPYCFLGHKSTRLIKGLKKPLVLFLNRHLKGARLVSCSRNQEEGRVLQLELQGESKISLRLVLFPGGQNIFVQVGDKSMSAQKPKELSQKTDSRPPEEFKADLPRFAMRWHEKKVLGHAASGIDGEKERAKQIKKKQSGLTKMQEKLAKDESAPWNLVGEWLKTQQPMDQCPSEFKNYLDLTKDRSWNIEHCFQQAKKFAAKKAGTLERIEHLKQELVDLQEGKKASKVSTTKSLLQVAEAKGRTQNLSNGWRLFIGKSAKDNLAILRRAKPWYLWLHIRDYPGAYGVVERNKKDPEPSREVLAQAAKEVLRQSVKGKTGGTHEVLIAECRYVRPIPKAKTGQVTYSHEKVVRVVIDE